MSLFYAFLWLTALLLVGWAFLRLLLRDAGKLDAALWLPMSFALGVGVVGLAMTLLQLIVGRWNAALLILAIALLYAITWSVRGRRGSNPEFQGFEAPGGKLPLGWIGAVGAMVTLLLALNFTNAVTFPFTSYDGRAIWNYKAMILQEERTVHTESFTDPLRVHYHRDYPLTVPTANLGIMALLGGNNERAIRLFYSTVFVYQGLFIFGALRRLGAGWVLSSLGVLYLAGTAFRNDWNEKDANTLNSGSADFPLALMVSIAAVMNVLWWRERATWQWICTAVFLAMGVLVKAEGILFVAAALGGNAIGLLFAAKGTRAVSARTLAAMSGLMVILVLPWILLKQSLPNHYDESYAAMLDSDYLLRLHERLPVVLDGFRIHLTDWSRWGLQWPVFLIVPLVAAAGWCRRGDSFLDGMLLLWLLALLVVYLLTPLDLRFHLSTSLNRLLSQVVPLCLIRVLWFVQDRGSLYLGIPGMKLREAND